MTVNAGVKNTERRGTQEVEEDVAWSVINTRCCAEDYPSQATAPSKPASPCIKPDPPDASANHDQEYKLRPLSSSSTSPRHAASSKPT